MSSDVCHTLLKSLTNWERLWFYCMTPIRWICLQYFKNGDANLKVSALTAFRDLERHI